MLADAISPNATIRLRRTVVQSKKLVQMLSLCDKVNQRLIGYFTNAPSSGLLFRYHFEHFLDLESHQRRLSIPHQLSSELGFDKIIQKLKLNLK